MAMRGSIVLVLIGLGLGQAGCMDIREFDGRWRGGIVVESAVRQGFAEDTRVDPLELSNVDLQGLTATLTTSDGKFDQQDLTPVHKFAADTLASLDFDGNPLRSYLLFGSLTSEPKSCAAMAVISLFSDDRVELRIIRGNDLFGVFSLDRVEPQ